MYEVTEIAKDIDRNGRYITSNKRIYNVNKVSDISRDITNLMNGIYTKERMTREGLNSDVISKVYDENNRIEKEFDSVNNIFKYHSYGEDSIDEFDEFDSEITIYWENVEFYDLNISRGSNVDDLTLIRTDYYEYKDEEHRYLLRSTVNNIETVMKYDENNRVVFKSINYSPEYESDNETLEEFNKKIMDYYYNAVMTYNEFGDIVKLVEYRYTSIENDKFITTTTKTKFKYDVIGRLVYKSNNIGEFNRIIYANKNNNQIILDETDKEIKQYDIYGNLVYERNHITGYEKFYIRDKVGRLLRSKDSDGNEDVTYYDGYYDKIIYQKQVVKK